MKDKTALEKHMVKNRPALDRIETPDVEGIWGKITADAQPKANKRTDWHISIGRNWWMSAAAVLLVGIIAFTVFRNASTSKASDKIQIAEYFPELADQEKQFQQLIAQKEKELNFREMDPSVFPDIFQELELLDRMHQEQLEDIPKYYDQQMVIRTIIRYYEQKIRLLERLSNEIKKNKHDDNLQFDQQI